MRWWHSFQARFKRPAPSFRLMNGADALQAASLHAASFARGWTELEMSRLITDPNVEANALVSQQRLAGFILSRIADDEAEVLTIAVDPAWRKQGLGRQLLGNHLARLAGRRVTALFLEVEDENKAARALYARSGFAQVGERQAYYARPDGTRGHALVLKRAID